MPKIYLILKVYSKKVTLLSFQSLEVQNAWTASFLFAMLFLLKHRRVRGDLTLCS